MPANQDGTIVKAPGDQGAMVVRFDGYIALTWVDWESGYRLVVGLEFAEYCNDIYDFDIVPVMQVYNPVDQDIVNELINARDVYVEVYPAYVWDCERFVNEGPLATGLVKFMSTDNDLYAYLDTNLNPRVNSFGSSANGKIFTPEGDIVLLNFTTRYVWPGYPDEYSMNEIYKINLAFTGP